MSDEKKVWTFSEMNTKVRNDLDLNEEDPDEQFITVAEMIGYFNEAIDEAEAEIMTLNQDYFLASDYIPLVEGTSDYDLPVNIFGKKIRGLVYTNGSIVYPIKRFREMDKFEKIAFAQTFTGTEDYRYFIKNNTVGSPKMVLIPAARETAILPPLSSTFTPIIRWYIRNANRIPYIGDYTNPEQILPAAVDASANTIAVDPEVTYVTGDAVKLSVTGSSTVPGGLTAGTVYYVIAVSSVSIKLATTAVNAAAGTAIDISSTGSGYFTIRVAATTAIVNATLIDIPEFSTFIMEWVKANCLYKDGDPRLSGTVAKLEQQRKMMVDTLVESEPDNDDQIEADFSWYNEMS